MPGVALQVIAASAVVQQASHIATLEWDTSARSIILHVLYFAATTVAAEKLIGPGQTVCAVLIGLAARCAVLIFELIGLSKMTAEMMIAASIVSTVTILMLVTPTSNIRPINRATPWALTSLGGRDL